jgi:hypothetical protein
VFIAVVSMQFEVQDAYNVNDGVELSTVEKRHSYGIGLDQIYNVTHIT